MWRLDGLSDDELARLMDPLDVFVGEAVIAWADLANANKAKPGFVDQAVLDTAQEAADALEELVDAACEAWHARHKPDRRPWWPWAADDPSLPGA